MDRKLKKALKITAIMFVSGIGLVAVTFLAMLLYIESLSAYAPNGDFDAMVILGASIYGEEVSPSLKSRLDTALKYISENDVGLIVVAGGQGKNESISEALAMKRYLVNAGVDENIILTEDKSTSTRENLFYSKPLLDEIFGEDYRILIVTNDFHCLRAGLFAEKAGLSADFLPAAAPQISESTNRIREYLALCWFFAYENHV